jgi:hypothetical protein
VTTTSHAALYRFTFPSDPGDFPLSPLIIADLTDLPNTRSGGTIEVDEDTGSIKGYATFSPSFGVGMLLIEHFEFKG